MFSVINIVYNKTATGFIKNILRDSCKLFSVICTANRENNRGLIAGFFSPRQNPMEKTYEIAPTWYSQLYCRRVCRHIGSKACLASIKYQAVYVGYFCVYVYVVKLHPRVELTFRWAQEELRKRDTGLTSWRRLCWHSLVPGTYTLLANHITRRIHLLFSRIAEATILPVICSVFYTCNLNCPFPWLLSYIFTIFSCNPR